MAYPEHPQTVIVQNKFYPQGLREIDVWEHYQRVKPKLLKEVYNRDLMFWIMVDVNKPIVLRKGTTTRYLRLTNSNYDDLIHGRVISIHAAMRRSEDIGIIDIDAPDLRSGKVAALETYEFAITKIPIIKTAEIRYTGKTGFHIFCTLIRKINIDSVRHLFKKFLLQSDLANKYTIDYKRGNVPNLDLAPDKFRGNYICLHALSIWGLQCMQIDHGDVLRFNPMQARIQRAK